MTLNKTEPGLCGCGVPDSDSDTDNDGIIDCLDNCPEFPNPDQTFPRYYADLDRDGFSDGSFIEACLANPGYFLEENLISSTGDCNDQDAAIYPGAAEVLNDGIDQDCNGRDSVLESSQECFPLKFASDQITSYNGNQDQGVSTIENDGLTVLVENNAWKAYPFSYTLTPNTVLEFSFSSTRQGELHEIGVDTDLQLRDALRFQLYGTQTPNDNIQDFRTYTGDGYQTFQIPIGQYRTGAISYLLFITDHDAIPKNGNSYFQNVKLHEGNCETELVDNEAPSPPQNVTLSALSHTSISLSWEASLDALSGVAGYHIYVNNSSTPYTSTAVNQVDLTNLTSDTSYEIRVSCI